MDSDLKDRKRHLKQIPAARGKLQCVKSLLCNKPQEQNTLVQFGCYIEFGSQNVNIQCILNISRGTANKSQLCWLLLEGSPQACCGINFHYQYSFINRDGYLVKACFQFWSETSRDLCIVCKSCRIEIGTLWLNNFPASDIISLTLE